jgi:phospholipid/cholesterol/gamma-HCH transport system substrate-binding protein
MANWIATPSQGLNDPNGSLGQLISNPEVYQHLSRALKNVDEITRDLKPVIEDARVFSDKIARHPEVLGVRGALHPSVGLNR